MELFKMILDQAAGVAIAILLIMRIETKLDGLTSFLHVCGGDPSSQSMVTANIWFSPRMWR